MLKAGALATFFVIVQFYTSLASLSPTPPVGYVFASRAVATALVGLLALSAVWCGVSLWRERALLGTSPSHAILAAWLGSAALSSFLGLDPRSSLEVVGMMVLGAFFHLALVRDWGGRGVPSVVLGTYLLAGIGATAAGLAMAVTRRPALLWAQNHGRAAGLFVTANQFAAFLIVFAFVALGCALGTRGFTQRLGTIAAPLALLALGATLSLAGLIGAVAGAVFYAAGLQARRLALAFVIVAVAGGGFLAVRPALAHDPAYRFDRLLTWEAGRRVIALFPLTGVGPMAYWRVYPAIRPPNGDPPGTFGALHPHNVYLSLAGETGAVGMAAFAYGWWRFVGSLRRRLSARSPSERRFVFGVCAALIAALVQGMFDTVGIVAMCFVWIPYTGLALAAVTHGFPESPRAA
ncbi:MAG: hypothetical protein GIX03_08165 [Candidatus Eremiobacteraeota bacterium]|nr:hypothetical protein [Candidatus Eremiobacteraeota bacterium]MBC5802960.1 hypothetical protein [Candidatus Eremiobacteraeota bacterium]MBC5822300.1 hypothetical protein [Candidatus Eremiobacteraeota bacterium]